MYRNKNDILKIENIDSDILNSFKFFSARRNTPDNQKYL